MNQSLNFNREKAIVSNCSNLMAVDSVSRFKQKLPTKKFHTESTMFLKQVLSAFSTQRFSAKNPCVTLKTFDCFALFVPQTLLRSTKNKHPNSQVTKVVNYPMSKKKFKIQLIIFKQR